MVSPAPFFDQGVSLVIEFAFGKFWMFLFELKFFLLVGKFKQILGNSEFFLNVLSVEHEWHFM